MAPILQWNIRSFNSHRPDLRFLLSRFNPSVVCLQETRLNGPPPPIPFYSYFSLPHSQLLTCLFIHVNTPYLRLSVSTSVPCTFARVFLSRWVTVVSLYYSPSVPIDYTGLAQLLSDLPPPILLLGDFNCRNPLWGDSVLNAPGRLLEDFLLTRDLYIFNSGSPTHFDSRTRTFSSIDLSTCTPSLSLEFTWSVLDDYCATDHFPIFLTPTSYHPVPGPPRWRFNRADWTTFTSLAVPPDPLSLSHDPRTLLSYFRASLLMAARASIPSTSRSMSSKCVPWWNATCTSALRVKRARWKSFRRQKGTPSEDQAFLLFKRANAFLRRTVRRAKKDSWRTYVSTINTETPIPRVWSRIRKMAGKRSPTPVPVLVTSDVAVGDACQVADIMGNHFSQVSSGFHLSHNFLLTKRQSEQTPIQFTPSSDAPYNAPYTSAELQTALNACGSTCDGPDGVHYQMLKHLSPSTQRFLLLYTTCHF